MINYMLPGFYEHYNLYKQFFYIKKNYPEYFKEDVNIYCVYGNFQHCPWDGGRIFTQTKTASLEDMVEVLHFYNDELNIPIRYVFTNTLITEEHCYDRRCNLMLELGKNYSNEIVVNSPILEKYIRENYPSYNIISSTTKCLTNQDLALKEIEKDYKLICLDYNLNKNFNFLESIPKEHREKIEILVNPICGLGCPMRAEHYRLNSLYNLTFGKPYNLFECKITETILHPEHFSKTGISHEEIVEKYLPLGINNIKLEGRTLDEITIATILAKYLIKEKYQFVFISNLIKNI